MDQALFGPNLHDKLLLYKLNRELMPNYIVRLFAIMADCDAKNAPRKSNAAWAPVAFLLRINHES